MNRRDFIKSALTLAALAPVGRLIAAEGADGDKASDVIKGTQITRRNYKNSAMTLPLLGFGTMRLPKKANGEIDIEITKNMVERAMNTGCNYFDTAYFYHGGKSETVMGEVLAKYPRNSFYLADKMPIRMTKKPEDVEKIFKEQLKKCRTEYFDFYLVHAVNAGNWKTAKQCKVYEFLSKMKQEGKIRKLGFSFHDKPEVLQQVVDDYPWDFAQIQLNYLDWTMYKSKEQYEILTKAGIPVIVMEPLRGGTLAALSPHAGKILKHYNKEASLASWAFRYLVGLPNVLCILSGMSKIEHLEDNIKTFSPAKPLDDSESKTLQLALASFQKRLPIPCTSCRYCLPCKAGVAIPTVFSIYNRYTISGDKTAFLKEYNALEADAKADACMECGACMKKCPQKINIIEEMKSIAKAAKN